MPVRSPRAGNKKSASIREICGLFLFRFSAPLRTPRLSVVLSGIAHAEKGGRTKGLFASCLHKIRNEEEEESADFADSRRFFQICMDYGEVRLPSPANSATALSSKPGYRSCG